MVRAGVAAYQRTAYPYPAGPVADMGYARSATSLRDDRSRAPQPPGPYGGRV